MVGHRCLSLLVILVLAACQGAVDLSTAASETVSAPSFTSSEPFTPTTTIPTSAPEVRVQATEVQPVFTSTATVDALPVSPAALHRPITPESAALIGQVAEMLFSPWALVTALAWSPDGRWLAAAGGDEILVLSAADLTKQATFPVGAFTHGLAFSPDGEWLAATSRDGFLRLWDMSAGFSASANAPIHKIQAHAKGANTLAFDLRGSLLATGGNDAVARFWGPGTGELSGMVVGGTFAVPAVAFDPTGGVLAVVNGDRIRLRDVESGAILGTLLAENSLYSLAYSPDGSLLAAGDNDNQVLLWDPAEAFRTGKETYPDPVVLRGHSGRRGSYQALVWRVVFSPDGRILTSSGGDGALCLWDVEKGELLARLAVSYGGLTSLAFHPEGKLIASGGLDGALRLWGVVEGARSASP